MVFEAVPHDDAVPYANRAETTAVLASELAPATLAAIGLDPGSFDAEIVVGGYQSRTNPSVLLTIDGDGRAADRAAAAFGHVFAQQAVLVWRDGGGETLAVSVQLPAVTPNLADHFFRHAAAVESGLAGGFTARGNTLVFINLRGRDGKPLSGLTDEDFAAALERATAAFGNIATVTSARVAARLVEREDYAGLIGSASATIERLRLRRVELGSRR